MAKAAVPRAYAAIQQAMELRETATGKERALIQAAAKRYVKDAPDDRSVLDVNYADAMRQVFVQFPDDHVIGGLLAEALMDLHPWDFGQERENLNLGRRKSFRRWSVPWISIRIFR